MLYIYMPIYIHIYATPGTAQELLLAMHLGIIPGCAVGTYKMLG